MQVLKRLLPPRQKQAGGRAKEGSGGAWQVPAEKPLPPFPPLSLEWDPWGLTQIPGGPRSWVADVPQGQAGGGDPEGVYSFLHLRTKVSPLAGSPLRSPLPDSWLP